MGNCRNDKPRDSNNENKESWEFTGEIYHEISDETRVLYWEIKEGKVLMEEINNKKRIYIGGNAKCGRNTQKFNFIGIESSERKGNVIKIKITKEKEKEKENKFDFFEEISMIQINNEYIKITGNLKYDKIILKMDLDLFLPKPKKEKQNTVVINFRYRLPILTDSLDIISNSLCGMINLINTCYINSSFQILIHIPELVKIIRDNKEFQGNVIGNINSVFEKILECRKESRQIIDPSIFVVNFKREHSEYNNYLQMDSEMFLEDLIWNINFELGALGNKRSINFKEAKNDKEKLFWNYLLESEEDSFHEINDLFYVSFIHENKCVNDNCNFVSYYFDETTGLKLNFRNVDKRNEIDLVTLIMNNFKKPMQIKSSYVCQKCRQSFYIKETTRIAKLPKILILSLQKTNIENTRKIPWIVKFENELDLKYLVDSDICKGSGKYKLFAINNHIGSSPRSGHYYSMIKLKKYGWYSFNDRSVTQIPSPTPDLSNYILIYEQI